MGWTGLVWCAVLALAGGVWSGGDIGHVDGIGSHDAHSAGGPVSGVEAQAGAAQLYCSSWAGPWCSALGPLAEDKAIRRLQDAEAPPPRSDGSDVLEEVTNAAMIDSSELSGAFAALLASGEAGSSLLAELVSKAKRGNGRPAVVEVTVTSDNDDYEGGDDDDTGRDSGGRWYGGDGDDEPQGLDATRSSAEQEAMQRQIQAALRMAKRQDQRGASGARPPEDSDEDND